MNYRPVSAGHEAREAPKTVEQVSLDERLVGPAEEWLGGTLTIDRARTLTRDITTTAEQAGLLALHPRLQKHKKYTYLGAFISVLWNHHCPETVITYRHNTPKIGYIGYELSEQKILHIAGAAEYHAGDNGEGPIIITGTVTTQAGWYMKGPLIITNAVGKDLGWGATGPLITLAPAEPAEEFRGIHIEQDHYKRLPKLKTYVDRLLTLAKENPEAITHEFGDGARISKRIKQLVGGGQ